MKFLIGQVEINNNIVMGHGTKAAEFSNYLVIFMKCVGSSGIHFPASICSVELHQISCNERNELLITCSNQVQPRRGKNGENTAGGKIQM